MRVAVADTGRGIPEADLERIFEPFRQASDTLPGGPRGTGLGLPIARQIVRAHDGDLLVSSAPGEGQHLLVHGPGIGRLNRVAIRRPRCAPATPHTVRGVPVPMGHALRRRGARLRFGSSTGRAQSTPAKEAPDMTTMKALAQRAIMFLGTMAAFAFVIDGAKRW